MKPVSFRRLGGFSVHSDDLGGGRALAAFFHHDEDGVGWAAEQGFDAAVETIAHPAREGMGARLFDRPSPIPHPLHPAFDADAKGEDIGHG
jgi:hypothetical protein